MVGRDLIFFLGGRRVISLFGGNVIFFGGDLIFLEGRTDYVAQVSVSGDLRDQETSSLLLTVVCDIGWY